MIRRGECRLIVDLNDLRRKPDYLDRAEQLLSNAFEEIVAFQAALKEFISSVDTVYSKEFEEFFVGFEGSFGEKHVTPRSLSARYLGNLICVEGIVTKASLVRPKVVRSVHYCAATKKTIQRTYTDLTSLEAFPSVSVYPTKDDDGHPLETEYGLSSYKDHQTLTIQEMPERAPAGQLPRSVEIIVDNDLVDRCKPGDRVQISGTYRCLPSKKGGFTSGTFRTVVLANNVITQSKETQPILLASDVAKIRQFSRQKKDVFEILARSLAPSIHGHDFIKKAVLCLLLGGVEKILENGTRLRGDINVLLIGDPSTAKSQMLRYVLHTAPRAVTTTGRGTSGVGLTAAVTTDQETGDRRLEAGAMVLADRGVVCIDEFDKMSDIDRTAIHEVMEQGRVTISKAGIHATLNARCSVLAAANPVYGRYDEYKNPMDNIGMQDSLISRFDLLFIVLDEMDPEHDRNIAEHVLRMHRYRTPGEQDGEVLRFASDHGTLTTHSANADAEEEEEDTPIYEKHDNLLHGEKRQRADRIVSAKFMRKYIHVARALKPTLTREASDLIATEYSKLRLQETSDSSKAKTQPVTARTLETMIRLATAHAKARMSKEVQQVDADAAIDLVNFAYFKKVLHREKRNKNADDDSQDEAELDLGDDEEAPAGSQQSTAPKGAKRRGRPASEGGDDPYDFDGDDSQPPAKRRRRGRRDSGDGESMDTAEKAVTLSADRLTSFRSAVQKAFASHHTETMPTQTLLTSVNKQASPAFSMAELRAGLAEMHKDNQVMLQDDQVFLI